MCLGLENLNFIILDNVDICFDDDKETKHVPNEEQALMSAKE
jgi:hypothetical protein